VERVAQPANGNCNTTDSRTDRQNQRGNYNRKTTTTGRQLQQEDNYNGKVNCLNCANIERIAPRASGRPNGPLRPLRWGCIAPLLVSIDIGTDL
jgi:hypothetical protein